MKMSGSQSFSNSFFRISLPTTFPSSKIGPLWISYENSWRYAADYLEIKVKNKPLSFITSHLVEDGPAIKRLILKSSRNIDVELKLWKDKKYVLISILKTKEKLPVKITLSINFDRKNNYDYVNLSGNLYKYVKEPLNLHLKVPHTGAFSQVWTIHSNQCFLGFIGVANSQSKTFSAQFNKNQIKLTLKLRISSKDPSNFYTMLGSGRKSLPIQTKFSDLDPIHPLPFKYKGFLQQEAFKSFRALSKFFLLKTPHGAVPANFIFPPEKIDHPFKQMNFGSFGNCFSLGYIYGTSALYQWDATPARKALQNELKHLESLGKIKQYSKKPSETILKTLTEQFLPPILKGAQLHTGALSGAFFDTYNAATKRWTTGRVQFPDGGYSDWFPFPQDRKGNAGQSIISLPKRELGIGGLRYLVSTMTFTLRQLIKTLPSLFKRIPKRVIYPAYSGQFAYFLLQTLHESLLNDNYLGPTMENDLIKSLKLTSHFLQDYQREDGLWDHELFEDGTIFWKKRTLACIYPATFLYWWSINTKNKDLKQQAEKAIQQCTRLMVRGEYYGIYFETNLAINQDDLVTGLACIKCFTRLYALTRNVKYLNHARTAAWHVLSYMWGNNTYDRLNNCITGGLPVTTYKGLGFPVIGGSELCQTIEALLELSFFDKTFLPYAEAALGYHSHYLYESNKHIGATHEIIWGIGENWSTSTSADFASYATGPFIRALYLYSQQLKSTHSRERLTALLSAVGPIHPPAAGPPRPPVPLPHSSPGPRCPRCYRSTRFISSTQLYCSYCKIHYQFGPPCPKCSSITIYLPIHGLFICGSCKEFLPGPPCPACHQKTKYNSQKNQYYCEHCKTFI